MKSFQDINKKIIKEKKNPYVRRITLPHRGEKSSKKQTLKKNKTEILEMKD